MGFIFSLLPVFLFLISLFLFDSFKLVRKNILLICLIWGIAAAGIAYFLNTALSKSIDHQTFTRYLAPFIEESLKAILVLLLVLKRKIGFTIDAAIYGFASGAGFALAENIVYMVQLGSGSAMVIWIIRGFGTAVMHGGCTALMAMLLIAGIQREKSVIVAFIPGLLSAILLHSAFNHFMLNPYLQTALIIIILPVVFSIVFSRSANMLQNWLELEFSNEVEILSMIRKGQLLQTKSGAYLASLKKHFAPEIILDLYCYVSLYIELSIKAKSNLMLRENDFPIIEDQDISEKLQELKQLRRQIGKMGEIAIKPLVRMNYRELWKLNQLKN